MSAQANRGPLWILGWREYVELPELEIGSIKAKLDTGARSSALHAVDMERFRRGGRDMIRFAVHPRQRDTRRTVHAEAELIDERDVRSSSGEVQRRPIVLVTIEIGSRQWLAEMSLASRAEMGFRLLLGRHALHGRFLVDSGRSFLAGDRTARRR